MENSIHLKGPIYRKIKEGTLFNKSDFCNSNRVLPLHVVLKQLKQVIIQQETLACNYHNHMAYACVRHMCETHVRQFIQKHTNACDNARNIGQKLCEDNS